MAEEIVNVVKTVSDGTVTMAMEKYQSLIEAAAVKAPVVYTTVTRTKAIQASDNKLFGSMLLVVGGCVSAVGGVQLLVGLKQARGL